MRQTSTGRPTRSSPCQASATAAAHPQQGRSVAVPGPVTAAQRSPDQRCTPHAVGSPLLPPSMDGLPKVCGALVAEFALFHQASVRQRADRVPDRQRCAPLSPIRVRTAPAPGRTPPAITSAVAAALSPVKDRYCATPYANDQGVPYSDFDDDERRSQWSGNGSARGDGEGGMRSTAFRDRAIIAPSTVRATRTGKHQAQFHRRRSPAAWTSCAAARRTGRPVADPRRLRRLAHPVRRHGPATTGAEILDAAGKTNHVPDGTEDQRIRASNGAGRAVLFHRADGHRPVWPGAAPRAARPDPADPVPAHPRGQRHPRRLPVREPAPRGTAPRPGAAAAAVPGPGAPGRGTPER